MQNIKIGEIYDESRVVRVDKGIGLLVEIPSSPAPSPAYINVCFGIVHSHSVAFEHYIKYKFCFLEAG